MGHRRDECDGHELPVRGMLHLAERHTGHEVGELVQIIPSSECSATALTFIGRDAGLGPRVGRASGGVRVLSAASGACAAGRGGAADPTGQPGTSLPR